MTARQENSQAGDAGPTLEIKGSRFRASFAAAIELFVATSLLWTVLPPKTWLQLSLAGLIVAQLLTFAVREGSRLMNAWMRVDASGLTGRSVGFATSIEWERIDRIELRRAFSTGLVVHLKRTDNAPWWRRTRGYLVSSPFSPAQLKETYAFIAAHYSDRARVVPTNLLDSTVAATRRGDVLHG